MHVTNVAIQELTINVNVDAVISGVALVAMAAAVVVIVLLLRANKHRN